MTEFVSNFVRFLADMLVKCGKACELSCEEPCEEHCEEPCERNMGPKEHFEKSS